jgi:hypothetical protein
MELALLDSWAFGGKGLVRVGGIWDVHGWITPHRMDEQTDEMR